MLTVFKKSVDIQMFNKTLGEWALYNSNWKNIASRMRLEVPDYQRDFVWKEEDYQSFIESIFDRVQLPPVYIDSRHTISKGIKQIIDGKHRIQALIRFFNDDLKVRGMFFSELSESNQLEFEDTIMPVFDVRRLIQKQIVELYLFLNFKAVPHTKQDKEKALQILASLTN